ncbi:hypothetical protein H257_12411 [Aphanomyces astaci]|uniref:Uncharacterized protein n=1 Tax=Aphanomyces astaci TaxID=112090 RepID=W4G057_APHAT|nr:hypothetical protein H257_12411 [Aphanomyces astaci]ETV72666.1 hypothetical protein H257_12411 [Aphanomyces astaci]|eukprot:XP_009837894.1 hypothetical protein H257_12411 [Aphanomyces astaci]
MSTLFWSVVDLGAKPGFGDLQTSLSVSPSPPTPSTSSPPPSSSSSSAQDIPPRPAVVSRSDDMESKLVADEHDSRSDASSKLMADGARSKSTRRRATIPRANDWRMMHA